VEKSRLNIAVIQGLNGWEIVAIITTILLYFGAKHLPAVARGLSEGIRKFGKDDDDDNGGGPLAT
jgi:Sec-independent protein translocase protein TatA